MFPDRPYKSICRGDYSTNRPYKIICRDPCVGAAGQTGPTNSLQPPLIPFFDVVWFFAAIAAHLHRRLRFVPKSSAAAITDAGLRRYGPGRVITLQDLSSPRDLLRNRKSTNLSPSRCVFHDFFLYVLASATYSLSYTLGFRIFYKDTMKCISMYCYREAGKTCVYSMHESTHISQYNLCSCW